MIKTIIFDFDGTLYFGDVWADWEEYNMALVKKVLKKRSVKDFFEKHDLFGHARTKNIILALAEEGQDFKKYIKLLNTKIYKHSIVPTQIISPDFLKEISKRATLYVVSMSQVRYLKHYFKLYGIDAKLFKGIYSAHLMEKDKTKAPNYEKILKDENILPEEAIVVGDDDLYDLEPARQLGINTYLLDDENYPRLYDFLREATTPSEK